MADQSTVLNGFTHYYLTDVIKMLRIKPFLRKLCYSSLCNGISLCKYSFIKCSSSYFNDSDDSSEEIELYCHIPFPGLVPYNNTE